MSQTRQQLDLQFDHVAQQVPDVADAVAWYSRTVPGCEVLYQDDSWAFLAVNGTKLALIQNQKHPAHVAWRVSEADLERLAAEHGVEVRTHRDGTRSFYLRAPGDNWIEMIAYPQDTPYTS